MKANSQRNKATCKRTPLLKKQRGMVTIDTLLGIGAVLLGIGFVSYLGLSVTSEGTEARLQSQVSTIKSAAVKWKGNAPNFTGITMAGMCTDNFLKNDICGGADGVSSNAYGGDFVVAANSNPGLLDVTVTMPSDPDSVNMVARSLARVTRDSCTAVTGCATINVTGTSIRLTY